MTEIIYCIFALLIGWFSYGAGVGKGFKLGVAALTQHLQVQMKKYDEALKNETKEANKQPENDV